MSDEKSDQLELWLEVSNVRLIRRETVEVQVKGDKRDREPEWWPLAPDLLEQDAPRVYRLIQESLDKKRPVIVQLQCVPESRPPKTQDGAAQELNPGPESPPHKNHQLRVSNYRIQSADSGAR